jgi:hypothetical protein
VPMLIPDVRSRGRVFTPSVTHLEAGTFASRSTKLANSAGIIWGHRGYFVAKAATYATSETQKIYDTAIGQPRRKRMSDAASLQITVTTRIQKLSVATNGPRRNVSSTPIW